ncbi:MAG: hypothetical protein ACLFQW_07955 [Spirochaetaceae bacterium]
MRFRMPLRGDQNRDNSRAGLFGTRKYSAFFLVLTLLPAIEVPLYPFEWPVKPEGVVATFGEYRGGFFFKGIEIETMDEDVRAIEAGEIIFSAKETPRHNGALPSGSGNSVVIEHERGIRSVYGHLPGIPGRLDKRTLDKNERLPLPGGHNGGRGPIAEDESKLLYLKILDSELEQAVNPLLSLPSVEDTRGVSIESVVLVPPEESSGSSAESREDASVSLGESSTAAAGDYEIHIEAFDSSVLGDSTISLAPFSFRVSVNGEEELNIRFEYIRTEEMTHTLSGTGGRGASEFYRDKWRFCPGTLRLNSGDAVIEVVVSDIAGNETAETYRLSIR